MSRKTPERKKARDLQKRTGWSYSECLRCTRYLTESQVGALILERMGGVPGDVDMSPGSVAWMATRPGHPIQVTPRQIIRVNVPEEGKDNASDRTERDRKA